MKKAQSVALMMAKMKLTDRALTEQIYDFHNSTTTAEGTIPGSLARSVIEDRRQFAKVGRQIDPDEIFDFSLAKRAMSDLKAAGWRP
jgi:hypothetical protein